MNLNKTDSLEEPKESIKEDKKNDIITLDEVVEKQSVKTPYRKEVFDKVIDLKNGKQVPYRFRPIDMDDYLEAQVDGTSEELANTVLSQSLLHNNSDEFYTREEIIRGIPKQWKVMILSEILSESGITIDPEILGF